MWSDGEHWLAWKQLHIFNDRGLHSGVVLKYEGTMGYLGGFVVLSTCVGPALRIEDGGLCLLLPILDL